MHLHILGICGTFMSGVAILAKQQGHTVTGSDINVYPPMSTQLLKQGITLLEGYEPEHIAETVDCVVVGNVIKRGNKAIEKVLNEGIPYVSGPQWLYENILKDRWVLAVAGTHGKTTTSSMLTWILEEAQLNPGFLIGGVPENFQVSARYTDSPYFVIEADEYDSAFFDKRSKFIHYHPKTLIFNNLEYDHADIFPNLAAIQQQFHYLIRTVPANGKIVYHAADENVATVLRLGCWSQLTGFASEQAEWQVRDVRPDGSAFEVHRHGESIGKVNWSLLGQHNVSNALAAVAAATHVEVAPSVALRALHTFKNVKRRLEIKGQVKAITIYDDFAHHPTAIATTLQGLRGHIGNTSRLIAVLEFGSFTMRSGVHKHEIKNALKLADMVICKTPEVDWGLKEILADFAQPTRLYQTVDTLVENLVPELRAGDHVVVMSNSGFEGIHEKLLRAIEKNESLYGT